MNCAMASVPLDRFIPAPDVRERFEVVVHAPAAVVLQTASTFDMQSLVLVKAIIRLREWLLRTSRPAPRPPQGLLEETRRLGWGVLDEAPGRYVICGARCQPWEPDVRFVALPPAAFAAYAEPGQVKIAWTLEALAVAPEVTRLAQETRAVATDEPARRRFHRYWRWARFGIVAIRRLMLPAVRRAAERRWALERAGMAR
jgi:hypothetical protein